MTAITDLSLPDRFTGLIEGLMKDVEVQVVWGWTPILLIKLLWRRLRHMKARFASILARFRAGTLATPGSARKPSARPPAAAEPPPLVLPRHVGWVLQTISGTLIPGYELEKLVAEPELAALVAEVPQLGRVLRPLCRMLAVRMPAWLRLPRRRAVRPPQPRPTLIRLGAGQLWCAPSGLWPTREQAEKFDAKIWVWPDER
jgi:hypothetical protein